MWTYEQTTGKIFLDGKYVQTGYSGRDEGLNDPGYQWEPQIGPIPCGLWIIGKSENHPKLGRMSLPLTPAPETETFGRSGFYCHGDNKEKNFTASHGCIIAPFGTRCMMAAYEGGEVIEVF